MSQLTSCSRELPEKLLGEPNECEAIIDGVQSAALIDTGSMVSSVSHHFWQAHMSMEALHPLCDLLTVNNASGDLIPYVGYVEVTVELPGLGTGMYPLLVVPDTVYNTRVPLLVSTNILSRLKDELLDKQGVLQKVFTEGGDTLCHNHGITGHECSTETS